MKNIAISALTMFLLIGCATTYQSKGFSGGFSETQLDENIFTVRFNGNGFTSAERASDFTILRSAELALQNGFTHFVIVDANQYTQTSTYKAPTTATTTLNTNTTGTASIYGNTGTYNSNTYGTATTQISGGQTYNISKPSTSNTIVCFKSKPEGFSYSAKFLVESLKKKYELGE